MSEYPKALSSAPYSFNSSGLYLTYAFAFTCAQVIAKLMLLVLRQSRKASWRRQVFRDRKDFSWEDMDRGKEPQIRGTLLTEAQKERNSRHVRGTASLIGNSFIDSWKHHILFFINLSFKIYFTVV